MRHFLSHHTARIRSGAFSRSTHPAPAVPVRNLCVMLLVACTALVSSSFAQVRFTTNRGDISRDGANTAETLLTPANVNKNGFGKLFTAPLDYQVMAQPLFMSDVTINGQSHNVVYVATMADSVYAIDADTGAQLWWVNFTNPTAGIITAQVKPASGPTTLPCGTSQGYNQEGIVGTPVIDPNTIPNPTMYLVAKTVNSGTVQLNLHALDITTGLDIATPVPIQATTTSGSFYKTKHTTVFNALHQMNRPGLLLLNGVLYLGFGSNSCNDNNTGWLLAYDEANLSQIGVFNTSPYWGLTSIWQAGNGIAADEAGNIFVETAEAGASQYDVNLGGQTYCNSVLKLTPPNISTPADYFTPWNVSFLNDWDLDLSSSGVLILPDQTSGPSLEGHELIASGKQGFVYVLDRDQMGGFSLTGTDQILQEIAMIPGTTSTSLQDIEFGGPAYWNNTVYFTPVGSPVLAYPLSGGLLVTPPITSAASYAGGHPPSVSANGNTNGIVWAVEDDQLTALNAVSLQLLYNSAQASGQRDALGPVGHFITQTVGNGKVYVGNNNSLLAYGLFHQLNVTSGNAQSAAVATALSNPIVVQASSPYTGLPDVGATVTFSDGGKGGSFNPPSAVADSNGNVSTIYTVSKTAGTYTLTITGTLSGVTFGNGTATAIALPDPALQIIYWTGQKQTGAAGSTLAKPIVDKVVDKYSNGIPGVTVNFSANDGGILSQSSVVTNASGLASTTLQLPTTVGTVTVTLTSPGVKGTFLLEYSVAGPPANIAITAGNGQSALPGTQLSALTVLVTDQYNNPISGNSVTFSDLGAGGTFATNPVVTGTNGQATALYTLPSSAETITIDASATGITAPAVFTETSQ
jgi:hypothetical protein